MLKPTNMDTALQELQKSLQEFAPQPEADKDKKLEEIMKSSEDEATKAAKIKELFKSSETEADKTTETEEGNLQDDFMDSIIAFENENEEFIEGNEVLKSFIDSNKLIIKDNKAFKEKIQKSMDNVQKLIIAQAQVIASQSELLKSVSDDVALIGKMPLMKSKVFNNEERETLLKGIQDRFMPKSGSEQQAQEPVLKGKELEEKMLKALEVGKCDAVTYGLESRSKFSGQIVSQNHALLSTLKSL